MQKQTVWVVDDGDGYVHGVFSKRRDALKVDSKPTCFIIDEISDHLNSGEKLWSVRMNMDGSGIKVSSIEKPWHGIGDEPVQFQSFRDDKPFCEITVWSKSKKSAVKVLNDKRLKAISSGEWDKWEKAKAKEEKEWKAYLKKHMKNRSSYDKMY